MRHGEAQRSVVWALAPSQQQAVTGDISVRVPTRCRVTAGRARCPQEPAAPGEHGAEMPCRPQGVPAHTAELVSGSKPSLASDLINITWPRRALSGTGSDTRTRGVLRVFPWSSPSGRDGFGKRQGAEGPNAASAFSSYSSESCSQWSARRVGETCPGTVRLAQPPCYRMDRSVVAWPRLPTVQLLGDRTCAPLGASEHPRASPSSWWPPTFNSSPKELCIHRILATRLGSSLLLPVS